MKQKKKSEWTKTWIDHPLKQYSLPTWCIWSTVCPFSNWHGYGDIKLCFKKKKKIWFTAVAQVVHSYISPFITVYGFLLSIVINNQEMNSSVISVVSLQRPHRYVVSDFLLPGKSNLEMATVASKDSFCRRLLGGRGFGPPVFWECSQVGRSEMVGPEEWLKVV